MHLCVHYRFTAECHVHRPAVHVYMHERGVIIENPKTMVTYVSRSKDRIYHPRFLALLLSDCQKSPVGNGYGGLCPGSSGQTHAIKPVYGTQAVD